MTTLASSPLLQHVAYAQSLDLSLWPLHGSNEPVYKVFTVASNDINNIVARSQKGEAAAFHQLFVRYRQDVAQIILRVASPLAPADLEDLVQDVFIQVFRSISKFNGRAKFTTWLYRVTVNVVLMHLRAKKSRPKFSGELPTEQAADEGIEPDLLAMRNQRVRAFYRLLDQLPEKKRTVFVLHELQGMPMREISEIVGAPTLTIRTRLFYARKQLLKLLDDDEVLAPYAHLLERKIKNRSSEGSSGKGSP